MSVIEKPKDNVPRSDVRELVRVSIERVISGKTGDVKKQCLTCSRWLDELDLVFGSCPYCLEEKARNLMESFRPVDGKSIFPRCAECNTDIVIHGLKMWDTLGHSFKLVCIDCGYKQLEKDRQYRETEWGYARGLR